MNRAHEEIEMERTTMDQAVEVPPHVRPAEERPKHALRPRQSLTVDRTELRRLVAADPTPPTTDSRPRTRNECRDGPRPCPWVGCRYHLYLEVSAVGSLILLHPDCEPWELEETCALDLAEDDGMTLEEVGAVLGVTRERARQIEEKALRKLNRAAACGEAGEEWERRAALQHTVEAVADAPVASPAAQVAGEGESHEA